MRPLTERDVERLAEGAAVLGTGGGGNTYLAALELRRLLRQGAQVRVVDPEELSPHALGPVLSGMGAPTVGIERLPTQGRFGELVRHVAQALGRPVDFVAVGEVGGANALRPLCGAAEMGIPAVDADPMGRAFPELQMCTYMICGVAPTPVVLGDGKGVHALLTGLRDGVTAERYARALTWAFGGQAALALGVVTGEEVRRYAIPRTLSLALRLGEALDGARRAKRSPVDAIAQVVPDAVYLMEGKVVDVLRRTTGGFARGTVSIEGLGRYRGQRVVVEFQNEYLVVRREDAPHEALLTVPDLLVVLEQESGKALGSETVRYGLRVHLMGLPAPWELKTPAALAVVGPRAFGYDVPFSPLPGDLLARPHPPAAADAAVPPSLPVV
jgi:DUF917 family protein